MTAIVLLWVNGAPNSRRKFAEALINSWKAYNITTNPSSGIGARSKAQLFEFLSSGRATGRSTAAGPMG